MNLLVTSMARRVLGAREAVHHVLHGHLMSSQLTMLMLRMGHAIAQVDTQKGST